MDFNKILDAVSVFFEREGVTYAVVGGFALHAYGYTRATYDLDFVVPSEAQIKLVPFLQSLGYETLHISSGYSNHLHSDSAMGRLDFIYIASGTARLLFAGCKPALSFGTHVLSVPRPEHLAAMKIQAMKNDPERTLREMADLQFLIHLPGVNEVEVRGYFERAGLLERYHDIQRLS